MNLQQEGHEPGNEEGHEQGYGQENEQGHQQDGQEGEDRSGSSFLCHDLSAVARKASEASTRSCFRVQDELSAHMWAKHPRRDRKRAPSPSLSISATPKFFFMMAESRRATVESEAILSPGRCHSVSSAYVGGRFGPLLASRGKSSLTLNSTRKLASHRVWRLRCCAAAERPLSSAQRARTPQQAEGRAEGAWGAPVLSAPRCAGDVFEAAQAVSRHRGTCPGSGAAPKARLAGFLGSGELHGQVTRHGGAAFSLYPASFALFRTMWRCD